jgi:hypothetical protein
VKDVNVDVGVDVEQGQTENERSRLSGSGELYATRGPWESVGVERRVTTHQSRVKFTPSHVKFN